MWKALVYYLSIYLSIYYLYIKYIYYMYILSICYLSIIYLLPIYHLYIIYLLPICYLLIIYLKYISIIYLCFHFSFLLLPGLHALLKLDLLRLGVLKRKNYDNILTFLRHLFISDKDNFIFQLSMIVFMSLFSITNYCRN